MSQIGIEERRKEAFHEEEVFKLSILMMLTQIIEMIVILYSCMLKVKIKVKISKKNFRPMFDVDMLSLHVD